MESYSDPRRAREREAVDPMDRREEPMTEAQFEALRQDVRTLVELLALARKLKVDQRAGWLDLTGDDSEAALLDFAVWLAWAVRSRMNVADSEVPIPFGDHVLLGETHLILDEDYPTLRRLWAEAEAAIEARERPR